MLWCHESLPLKIQRLARNAPQHMHQSKHVWTGPNSLGWSLGSQLAVVRDPPTVTGQRVPTQQLWDIPTKILEGHPPKVRVICLIQCLGFKTSRLNKDRRIFPPKEFPTEASTLQERFNKASARVAKSSQSCSDHSEPPAAHGFSWQIQGSPPPNDTHPQRNFKSYLGMIEWLVVDKPLESGLI